MEQLTHVIIGSTVTVAILLITGVFELIKNRKELGWLKEDIKRAENQIKETQGQIKETQGQIKETQDQIESVKTIARKTDILAENKIDPNVLKILDHSTYLYEDTEYKNKLSEEYKGKISRNLMLSNVDAVYDKIVELEMDKSKIINENRDLQEEISTIDIKLNRLRQENSQLEIEKEQLQLENEELKRKLIEIENPKRNRDVGLSL